MVALPVSNSTQTKTIKTMPVERDLDKSGIVIHKNQKRCAYGQINDKQRHKK